MPYLIDGHNLLGQISGLSLESAVDRQRLVSSLSRFAGSRRCRITVFFDGEPPAGWGDRIDLGGVQVRHSGRGRSADDAILQSIRRSATPADITLVTSDRALYERGRHLGARAMQCRGFREEMARERSREGPSGEKPERPEPGEVDYFMELFGEAGEADPIRSRRRR
jgi:predicted RNA-binding protein with PIN domain